MKQREIESCRLKGNVAAAKAKNKFKNAPNGYNKQLAAVLQDTSNPETFRMTQPKFRGVPDNSTVWGEPGEQYQIPE